MSARDPRAHRRAIALMIVAATLWSIAGVVTRRLDFAERWEVTFWRSLFAALFVLAALLVTHGGQAWAAVCARAAATASCPGAMWAIMFVAFMLALMTTTVANTLIVNSITPLITALARARGAARADRAAHLRPRLRSPSPACCGCSARASPGGEPASPRRNADRARGAPGRGP